MAEIENFVWFLNLEKRLRDAYKKLKKRGIPLASNQVNYSLIYRTPEENGVKATCDELGITLIAYSPIAQGKSIQVGSDIMLVQISAWNETIFHIAYSFLYAIFVFWDILWLLQMQGLKLQNQLRGCFVCKFMQQVFWRESTLQKILRLALELESILRSF